MNEVLEFAVAEGLPSLPQIQSELHVAENSPPETQSIACGVWDRSSNLTAAPTLDYRGNVSSVINRNIPAVPAIELVPHARGVASCSSLDADISGVLFACVLISRPSSAALPLVCWCSFLVDIRCARRSFDGGNR